MNRLYACAGLLLASLSAPVHAQTIEDGIMMTGGNLLTGDIYTHESWDEYWEGALKRVNGNIGTVTTATNVLTANYGLTDRMNFIGMVPYVWTKASQGVLHGIEGFQDLTLAAKYSFLEKTSANHGSVRAITVLSAGIPLTNYNPELPPLSIGGGGGRVSWRGTLHYEPTPGWFFDGSTAYTWRGQVMLDRPYYYTDDTFVMSSQVEMPNAVDYTVSAGYRLRRGMTTVSFSQLRTLGGGDIRRQDMPFVSNRMNFSKVGAMAMYPIPKLAHLEFQVAVARTVDGRNVGQATSFTFGLLYRLHRSSIQ